MSAINDMSNYIYRVQVSETSPVTHLKEDRFVGFQELNQAMNYAQSIKIANDDCEISVVRKYDDHIIWSNRDSDQMKFYGSFDRDHWQSLSSIQHTVSDDASVYFDIDGTLGYWYQDTRGMVYPDEVLDPKSHYFANIAPHPFMIELAQRLQDNGNDVCIVSAADVDTIRDKMEWVHKYCPFIKDENIFFCPLGADKTNFIKGNAEKSVLIDDYKVNLEKWVGKSVKAINSINSVDDKYICIEGYRAEQNLVEYEKLMSKAISDIDKALSNNKEYNDLIEDNSKVAVGIFQLDDTNPLSRNIMFECLDYINKKNVILSSDLYNLKYAYELPDIPSAELSSPSFLESVFTEFNINRPIDFKGHSLSVSDVVVINDHGNKSVHFVDRFGYSSLEHFFLKENSLQTNKMLSASDEYNILSPNPNTREYIALHGSLDVVKRLINDKDDSVRAACARNPLTTNDMLLKLMDDDSWVVRYSVAERGFGLDVLVNDTDFRIRKECAQWGVGLDQLVNDEDEYVRKAVVQNGNANHLKVLINDKNEMIREEVARRGFGLETLKNDKNPFVRAAALDTEKKLKIQSGELKPKFVERD